MRNRRVVTGTVLAILLAMPLACEPEPDATGSGSNAPGGGGPGCLVGSEGCKCTPGLGCDAGLVCTDGICHLQSPACGNGVIEGAEECDLGGALNSNTGLCKTDCTAQVCGDGLPGPTESCDDGNAIDDDQCTNACRLPGCGDGVLQPGESCDDGNASNTDACTTLCKAPACSDGFLQTNEECDEGPANSPAGACTPLCSSAICGDGFTRALVEQCDDGNTSDVDGCTTACNLSACGDGFVQPSNSEACDDGNLTDSDSCTNSCEIPFCGDGITTPLLGEQCDDANMVQTDGCTTQCKTPGCGDGVVQPGEACDDGNATDTDDCTNQCSLPVCGDAIVWGTSEACDDGNLTTGDGCAECSAISTVSIGSTAYHACAIMTTGNLKCWGSAMGGALGTGDANSRGDNPNELGAALPPVSLGTSRKALAVATGYGFSCAVLDNHTLKCWGLNNYGQLGLGDSSARGGAPNTMGDMLPAVNLGTGRTAKAVACGSGHACAILDDGALKCWGFNSAGQLGLGDTITRGTSPAQMGNGLPQVNLGTGRTAIAVTAMELTTCAMLDDSSIKCWGSNLYGVLGQGDTQARGDGPNEMGDALAPIDLGAGNTVQSITAGGDLACALTTVGQVKCWGPGAYLGLGDLQFRGDNPNEMGANLPFVPLAEPAVSVQSTNFSTCAILASGNVKCWGHGANGALGTGNTNLIGDQPGEMASLQPVALGTGRTAVQLGGGESFKCAKLDNLTLKCWGRGGYGSIGSGATNDIGDGANEMGDNLAPVQLP